MNIAVIDYQSGNLGSVVRAIQTVAPQANVFLANTVAALENADRWIFPGQGAIPQAMKALESSGLTATLKNGFGVKPILGICVGLQILFDKSEEISTKGHSESSNTHFNSLGWIHGDVKKFQPQAELKVPHMGWSQVHQKKDHPMWHKIAQDARFYFAHSFYCAPENPIFTAGETDYGVTYASAITMPKLFGVQFHPEKSGRDGLQLLKNFVNVDL